MDICIDFDGTIVTHEYPEIGRDIGAIPVLEEIINNGHIIILFTMRSGEELAEAVAFLEDYGIHLYGVNINPTQEKWTGSPKAYGQLYIDDAGINIPLIRNYNLSERKYVDWDAIRNILEDRGII